MSNITDHFESEALRSEEQGPAPPESNPRHSYDDFETPLESPAEPSPISSQGPFIQDVPRFLPEYDEQSETRSLRGGIEDLSEPSTDEAPESSDTRSTSSQSGREVQPTEAATLTVPNEPAIFSLLSSGKETPKGRDPVGLQAMELDTGDGRGATFACPSHDTARGQPPGPLGLVTRYFAGNSRMARSLFIFQVPCCAVIASLTVVVVLIDGMILDIWGNAVRLPETMAVFAAAYLTLGLLVVHFMRLPRWELFGDSRRMQRLRCGVSAVVLVAWLIAALLFCAHPPNPDPDVFADADSLAKALYFLGVLVLVNTAVVALLSLVQGVFVLWPYSEKCFHGVDGKIVEGGQRSQGLTGFPHPGQYVQQEI
ncbi:hypothetical protein F4780DRAFT_499983 [Xylariomycetidae sp. FL0641]|nr:hypothetical protein F4780DRAFT_499983 [Xylariomycetidae sp. FL0641]